MQKSIVAIISLLSFTLLAGCAPMVAGQVAEAGYNAAKTSLGGAFGATSDKATAAGEDPRQQKMQSVLNSVEVGQDATAIVGLMGEDPKLKSGNGYGFTCYEYSAVYSATDAAVILAKNGKVVFFGNSRCVSEMQDANFIQGGKYAAATAAQAQ